MINLTGERHEAFFSSLLAFALVLLGWRVRWPDKWSRAAHARADVTSRRLVASLNGGNPLDGAWPGVILETCTVACFPL